MVDALSLPRCTVVLTSTVESAQQWQQEHPSWLYRAILDNAILDQRADDAADGSAAPQPRAVSVEALGSIPLPDGRLVACDPYLVATDQPPFVQTAQAGTYPVAAAIATIAPGHTRVLAAVIVFSDANSDPITRWELGRTGPISEQPLAVGEFLGYGVDAGTGCFASPDALVPLCAAMKADAGMLEDPLSQAIDLSPHGAAVAVPSGDQDGGLAVAAFHSGWGDGTYPTWFGYADSADGTGPLLALTDFMLFSDPWEQGDPTVRPGSTEPAPLLSATHTPATGAGTAAAPQLHDHADYAGRISAEEAAAALHPPPRKPGFWARIFGRH